MVKIEKPRLNDSARQNLNYLDGWLECLPMFQALMPEKTTVMVVDMTNGFCNEGVLASPRVKAIIPPIVRLLKEAWDGGVRDFYLLNDTHEPDAVEFAAFPPHCVRGTAEPQPVQEIKNLKFFDQIQIIEKNSLSSVNETMLLASLRARPDLKDFIIVGNCTDLCVYQLAMELRIDANVRWEKELSIIVPEDCVATYDIPVELALKMGAAPHPGDLMHAVFLHHMSLNGIQVVKQVAFTQ